jgi:hypothetical protein
MLNGYRHRFRGATTGAASLVRDAFDAGVERLLLGVEFGKVEDRTRCNPDFGLRPCPARFRRLTLLMAKEYIDNYNNLP